MTKRLRKVKPIDLDIDDLGTLVLFASRTLKGAIWLTINCEAESWQWFGNALCVDSRYAKPLLALAKRAGLRVKHA